MNPSLQERFDEIAAASKAKQQVEVLLDLAKSPKLPQSRDARRESWASLVATANAHLAELDRLAGVAKRARKPREGGVPIRAGIVPATGNAITAEEVESKLGGVTSAAS